MSRSGRYWKGITLSCLCILFNLYPGTDGRRYDKCTFQDGRQGVCVVKRYCREASSQHLLPCESDDGTHCCPIPTHRSAATSRPSENDSDLRNEQSKKDRFSGTSDKPYHRPEVSRKPVRFDHPLSTSSGTDRVAHSSVVSKDTDRYNRPSKLSRDHDSRSGNLPRESEKDNRRSGVSTETDRDNFHPNVDRESDRDDRRSGIPRDSDRDNRRSGVSRDTDRDNFHPSVDRDDRRSGIPRDFNRDDRRSGISRDSDKDNRRSGVSRDTDRDKLHPSVERESDRDDRRSGISRDFNRDDRRSGISRDSDRDNRRSGVSRDTDRDNSRSDASRDSDRSNRWPKVPTDQLRPSESRRPNRNDQRPEIPRDFGREDELNRKPPVDRRPSSNSASDRRPVRPPDGGLFYPSIDELNLHRGTQSPRSVKPHRNDSNSSSKHPIRFPDPYETPAPRPKVPACGVKPFELFIAGGVESDPHEWPWMTAIFRRYLDSRPKTFVCGGSLINTKYVLTAAHCFINNYVVLPSSAFVVRLGSHLLSSGEEYTVANIVIHQNHSGSNFFNDIALMRLASEVYITDKVAPVCLPPYPEMLDENLVGRLATVAGWGDVSFRSTGARKLQHVTVPIVSEEDCFGAYNRMRGAAFLALGSDYVICAGLLEGGKDACLGDSGGPLMLKMADDRWVVIGIVSLGYKCAEPGYPGVYTRVTHYMTWIRKNMKKH